MAATANPVGDFPDNKIAFPGNQPRLTESEHIEFVFFEPPLADLAELSINKSPKGSLAESFE